MKIQLNVFLILCIMFIGINANAQFSKMLKKAKKEIKDTKKEVKEVKKEIGIDEKEKSTKKEGKVAGKEEVKMDNKEEVKTDSKKVSGNDNGAPKPGDKLYGSYSQAQNQLNSANNAMEKEAWETRMDYYMKEVERNLKNAQKYIDKLKAIDTEKDKPYMVALENRWQETENKRASEDLKANPDRAPKSGDKVYYKYSCAKDRIANADREMKSEDWKSNRNHYMLDVNRYLKDAKECIDHLRAIDTEKDKPYLKKLESSWQEVDDLRASEDEIRILANSLSEKIQKVYQSAMGGHNLPHTKFEEKKAYENYYKIRDEYLEKFPEEASAYPNVRPFDIPWINAFFATKVYEHIPYFKAEFERIKKDMYQDNSGDPDYMFNWESYTKYLEELESEAINCKEILLEKHEGINPVIAEIQKEKNMLTNYVESGQAQAHKDKWEKELIERTRLDPPAMSNSNLEAFIKNNLGDGTVMRVVLTNRNWQVFKNDLGIPDHKSMTAQAAVSRNGKCYKRVIFLKKIYEGGGVYGNAQFNAYQEQEMKCANVYK